MDSPALQPGPPPENVDGQPPAPSPSRSSIDPPVSPPWPPSPSVPSLEPYESPPPPPPPSNYNGKSSSGMSTAAIVGIVLGNLGLIIVLVGVCIFVCRHRKKKRDEAERLGGGGRVPEEDPSTGLQQQNVASPTEHKVTVLPGPVSSPRISPLSKEPSVTSGIVESEKPFSSAAHLSLGFSRTSFAYEELSKATDDFSKVNLLGQGGFGFVYKGILSDGKMVAVKQLRAGSRQGKREFQAEVETISRVHHRHLVSLVGYCIAGDQMLLVYEFVPNNTLEFHLHGKGRPTMNWATRMKIAIGSAKGLAYLHEDCFPKIVHRDIKGANILLDHSFEAKVADFGLAKYFSDTETHVSTRVMGTFGYMAPEYASSGKLTERSDVFSFGVVLLELITGHRPVAGIQSFLGDTDSIVDWARPLLQQALQVGNYETVVDPKLQNDYDINEMVRMITCAVACVNHAARHRPQMSQIVRALEGNLSLGDLNKGPATGYVTSYFSYENTDYGSGQYKEDLVKFRKLALESQEQSSSEYSAYTSDNVMNPSSSSTEGQQTTQEMKEKSPKFQRRQQPMQVGGR